MAASSTGKKDNLEGCYGSQILTSEVKRWLIDNLKDNMSRTVRITLNIWSAPGVGKTSMVKSLASCPVEWKGKKWPGFEVIDIPLAQIEEMGDVLGFPVEEIKMTAPDGKDFWIKAVDTLIRAYLEKGYTSDGTERTRYAPPAWVPTKEAPGILLFDDGNRASQRIMKGLMQLVQDYRTISWELPQGWTIVFTGNPDNRMNQVTTMDSAQLTRMKHVTLKPDVKEWANWAHTQPDIDPRLINFLLKNPDMLVAGERTNPRSLTEFGRALKRFPDLKDQTCFNQCKIEACASLDIDVVNSLLVFLIRDVELCIEPENILHNVDDAISRLKKLMKGKEPRLDIVHITNSRLQIHLLSENFKFQSDAELKNIQKWLLESCIPKDQVFAFIKMVYNGNNELGRKIFFSNGDLKKLLAECLQAPF